MVKPFADRPYVQSAVRISIRLKFVSPIDRSFFSFTFLDRSFFCSAAGKWNARFVRAGGKFSMSRCHENFTVDDLCHGFTIAEEFVFMPVRLERESDSF